MWVKCHYSYFDGPVQRRNSIANTLEWRLSCINPSIRRRTECRGQQGGHFCAQWSHNQQRFLTRFIVMHFGEEFTRFYDTMQHLHVYMRWDWPEVTKRKTPHQNIIEAKIKWSPFSRRHFQMDFLEWKCMDFDKISLKFVPRCPISNITSLVQIMASRRPGDKPLSEPMVVSLPTHICVARPQWVN